MECGSIKVSPTPLFGHVSHPNLTTFLPPRRPDLSAQSVMGGRVLWKMHQNFSRGLVVHLPCMQVIKNGVKVAAAKVTAYVAVLRH